jgi:L-alanine-DL-glutamate epimerase-like enolase superfamily enzyme
VKQESRVGYWFGNPVLLRHRREIAAEPIDRGLPAGPASVRCWPDPFDLEAMRFKILNPTAALYNNRTHLHSVLEFACIDLIGKKLGIPAYQLLGGKLRDRVEFAS